MNPKTNEFEQLSDGLRQLTTDAAASEMGKLKSMLLRPNGEPVPEHWSVFTVDEKVTIKNYTFKVAHIGEKHILFEPVGPIIISEED